MGSSCILCRFSSFLLSKMQHSAKCIINTLVASTNRAAHFIFAIHPSVFSNNCLDIIIRTHYSILAKLTNYLRVKDGHWAVR